MHASDIMDITIAVEEYMKGRGSSPNIYNVVNALDKLGYLSAQQRVHLTEGGLSAKWASKVNSLCNIIIDAAGKKYVSSNDLDMANDVLDEVIPLLEPPTIGK